MTTETINITDKFNIIGGNNTPPKKTKVQDEDEQCKKSKIPFSENDIEGLTYIQED